MSFDCSPDAVLREVMDTDSPLTSVGSDCYHDEGGEGSETSEEARLGLSLLEESKSVVNDDEGVAREDSDEELAISPRKRERKRQFLFSDEEGEERAETNGSVKKGSTASQVPSNEEEASKVGLILVHGSDSPPAKTKKHREIQSLTIRGAWSPEDADLNTSRAVRPKRSTSQPERYGMPVERPEKIEVSSSRKSKGKSKKAGKSKSTEATDEKGLPNSDPSVPTKRKGKHKGRPKRAIKSDTPTEVVNVSLTQPGPSKTIVNANFKSKNRAAMPLESSSEPSSFDSLFDSPLSTSGDLGDDFSNQYSDSEAKAKKRQRIVSSQQNASKKKTHLSAVVGRSLIMTEEGLSEWR